MREKHAGEGRIPRGSARWRVGEVVMVSIMTWRDDNRCHRAIMIYGGLESGFGTSQRSALSALYADPPE
jgi:hypothetical protein